ncbi:hypothetical protein BofuT4_uP069720.1 [Botrytis cinerea T4]|uniref:Peptidase S1 domain-containing protein n=1 Tax=Botryotinia fuckeliana (strain T4) TaxID=999810 RepID=G2XQM7_BOTF4|nr:hypothetical protein BofuT4_uP069720.1 [Botrytis cinerea T4]
MYDVKCLLVIVVPLLQMDVPVCNVFVQVPSTCVQIIVCGWGCVAKGKEMENSKIPRCADYYSSPRFTLGNLRNAARERDW